ncbi:hypothetical protein [Pseudomonas putida]|uniref:hypothetical protein n=1 Tax=Pseudomonas putida TaxID=303 RepID=UPI0021F8609D|nr:hypothetical protein [Pseudomonas putida]
MIKIFIGVLFGLLFFSDFAVLTLGLSSVFAGWREMISLLIIMWLLLRALATVTARGTVNLDVARSLLIVLFFAFLYLLFGDLSASSLRMFRALAVPVFVGMAVAIWAQAMSIEKKLRHVYWSVLAMSVLTGVYALYQYLTIASAEQFWYWPLLSAKGYELQPYNSMRDGLPRVSGFFTGTLEFSAVILNTAAMTLAVLLSGRNWSLARRLLLSAAFVLLCGLIVIGSVRTAMIGLVCICMMLVVARVLRTAWLISMLGYLQFVVLTVAIFAYLSMGYTQDLSALDRERQWLHMYQVLTAHPMGYGFGAVGPGQPHWFDSFWLNLLATCGVVGLLIMAGLILWYHKLVTIIVRDRPHASAWKNGLGNFVIASYPFFLSSFFFQSYTNSVVLYIFAVVVMVIIGENRRKKVELGSTDRSVSES